MKKVVIMLLSAVLILSFAACSQPAMNEADILAAAQEILDKQNSEEDVEMKAEESKEAEEDSKEDDQDNSVSGVVEKEPETNTDELAKNITVDVYPLANGEALIKLTNNNSSDIQSLDFSITFYDDDNKIVKNVDTYFSALGAGKEVYTTSYDLKDSEVDFDNYKEQIVVEDYDLGYKNAINDIKVEANISDDGTIMAEITNTGSETISSMNAMALFYFDDELVAASYDISFDLKAGGFDVLEFWPPVDKNYDKIGYDRYTVFVNEAYTN